MSRAKGRSRERILDGSYTIYILEGEAENVRALLDDSTRLKNENQEMDLLLQEMAASIMEYENVTPSESNTCTTPPSFTNRGRTIEEVSPRQRRRKLKEIKTFTNCSLWFAESFGLIPEFVQMRKQNSGSPVKITLNKHNSNDKPQPGQEDYESVEQILYILDRFTVSDEAYHELSIASNLPTLSKMKKARATLNSSLDLRRLSGGYPGVFRPFKATLHDEIKKAVS